MNRIIRLHPFSALAVLAIAGLALLSSCSVTPGGSSGATGRLNVLVTDSPSDDWQQVTVVLKSISLRKQLDHAYVDVWTPPDPSKTNTLNLVDLSGVSTFLTAATIPTGIYDRLKLVIDTDPTTMTLVDDSGNTIAATDITVVDPSGKGEIKVDLSPAITVAEDGTSSLQVDFDLAHPLSIIVQNGKVILNLQVRHKALPRNLHDIQFARTMGTVKEKTDTGFTITTDQGSDVVFGANNDTIFFDVDNNKAGSLTDMPTGTGHFALVDSNMNSDGSLYARRVWYSADETKLPKFSPEGVVRRVGDNWIKLLKKDTDNVGGDAHYCHWDSDVIFVNENTIWTFKTDVSMGTGTAVLKNIRRGFRVSVEFVDATATTKVAKSIDVQSAHDEGAIKSVSATGFTFGGTDYCNGWNYGNAINGGRYYSHEWLYSAITDHVFSWWFFGLPSSSSTVIQDFEDTVNQAKAAHLRVFARAELYWDITNNQWVAENVILAPEKLPDPEKITTAYTAASGSMGVSTFDWDDNTLPTVVTVFLDSTGDLQTLVGSIRWNSTTKVLTFTVPVLSGQWETLLTPSLLGVRVWVRPVKGSDGTFTWHAYTVIAFQIIG